MSRVNYESDQKLPIALLDTPFVIDFWISGSCNMSCRYCLHGIPKDAPARRDMVSGMLSLDDFLRVAEGMDKFPHRVPGASFCGIGEPLTNPLLPEMIAYLKEHKLVSTVQLSTNGLLLDHAMADRLIDAGVDFLSVSIQGIDTEGYRSLCGVPADPEKIAENIAYYHEHQRSKSLLVVRTLDLALPHDSDEERFHELFDPVADQTVAAHAVKLYQGMDYSGLIPVEQDQFRGGKMRYGAACPLPFSTLHIRPNGNIAACPLPVCPGILGNIKEMTLQQAWNSRKRYEIMLAHAKKNREALAECRECTQPNMLAPDVHIPEELAKQIRAVLEK